MSRLPKAEFVPGVQIIVAHDGSVFREDAANGAVTLGVPLGNDKYVLEKTESLVRQTHGLARLARASEDLVKRWKKELGF